MAVERAESGEKGEKKELRLLWGHPSASTHRGHSLRTRGWHTKHTHLSHRAVIFPFMTRRHGTKQKHRVAIKWITLLDPALLICRRLGRVGYKARDARAVFPKLYGSCNSPPGWLSAGAAQQAHTYTPPARYLLTHAREFFINTLFYC
jgi:hypothetical protein